MDTILESLKSTNNECTVLYQKVLHEKTQPLTPVTVSKKHIRILVALFMLKKEEQQTKFYLVTDDIRVLVEQLAYKRYSLLDITAFTDDLVERNYVMIRVMEHKAGYRLSDTGEAFLEHLALCSPEYLQGSTTPNYHPQTQ